MENTNQNSDETKMKMLYAFIRECEEMLRDAKGLPNKEASILKRLNDSQRNLDILLAKKLHDTVREEGLKLQEHIKDIKYQIDEESEKFTERINSISRERKIALFYNTDYEVILRQSCDSVLEFEVNLKRINVTPIQFELLCALARKSMKDSKLPSRQQGWMHYDDIKDVVTVWDENTQEPQIRPQISQLRQKLDENSLNKWLLQNDIGGYYRLSTHPENIIIE